MALLLCAVVAAAACSDDDNPAADSGLADGATLLDGASELGSDGAAGPTCAAGAALLAKVDPARMLKDLNFLEGLGERRTHASQKLAADYLRSELKQLPGVDLSEHSYTYSKDGLKYVNLIAEIKGTTAPSEYVFMGAHYDSNSNHPTAAPGADDNASGTAAVLEVARALAGCRLGRSVRLLFFSNEEKGIIGSTAYVKSIKATLPTNKLLGYINVDMVGYGPDTEDLDLATKPAYKELATDMGVAVEKWTKLKVKQVINDHCG